MLTLKSVFLICLIQEKFKSDIFFNSESLGSVRKKFLGLNFI